MYKECTECKGSGKVRKYPICTMCDGTGNNKFTPYKTNCEQCKGHGITGIKWNFDLPHDIKVQCVGCRQGYYYENWHKPQECFERFCR